MLSSVLWLLCLCADRESRHVMQAMPEVIRLLSVAILASDKADSHTLLFLVGMLSEFLVELEQLVWQRVRNADLEKANLVRISHLGMRLAELVSVLNTRMVRHVCVFSLLSSLSSLCVSILVYLESSALPPHTHTHDRRARLIN